MSQDGNIFDGTGWPRQRLGSDDQEAADALVAADLNPEHVSPALRERAKRILAIFRAVGHCPTDEQSAAKLVDRTLTGLGAAPAGRTRTPREILTTDDEEALDAWQLGEHRVSRVASSLRPRAERIEAIGALITAVPAVGDASDTARLVDSTLARLETDREARARRGPLPFERSAPRQFKLADLVSIAAVLAIATGVIWPVIAGGRSHMQQIACRSNLGDAATGLGLYANDFRGSLPMATACLIGLPWWDVGTPERSNSANLFTMPRNRYTKFDTLNCAGNPNCSSESPTEQDRDWSNLNQVSFSYRVMFGANQPVWHDPSNTVVLSDRSPVVLRAFRGEAIFPTENSPNHDGRGQNVVLLDGSARWQTTPIVGNGDNMWLPNGIERVLHQAARAFKPGMTGYVQVNGWIGTTRAEPIKGIETPGGPDDAFVGP